MFRVTLVFRCASKARNGLEKHPDRYRNVNLREELSENYELDRCGNLVNIWAGLWHSHPHISAMIQSMLPRYESFVVYQVSFYFNYADQRKVKVCWLAAVWSIEDQNEISEGS